MQQATDHLPTLWPSHTINANTYHMLWYFFNELSSGFCNLLKICSPFHKIFIRGLEIRKLLAVHACVWAFTSISLYSAGLQFGGSRRPQAFGDCIMPVNVNGEMMCKGELQNYKHNKCTPTPLNSSVNSSVDGTATRVRKTGHKQLAKRRIALFDC